MAAIPQVQKLRQENRTRSECVPGFCSATFAASWIPHPFFPSLLWGIHLTPGDFTSSTDEVKPPRMDQIDQLEPSTSHHVASVPLGCELCRFTTIPCTPFAIDSRGGTIICDTCYRNRTRCSLFSAAMAGPASLPAALRCGPCRELTAACVPVAINHWLTEKSHTFCCERCLLLEIGAECSLSLGRPPWYTELALSGSS